MSLFKFNPSETVKKVSEVFISNPKKYSRYRLYYQILELKCKKHFDKLIIETLLTNDYVVDKLDINSFGFKDNVIYKKDIIDETTFYGEMNDGVLRKELTKEFNDFFITIIEDGNIATDIENHINVLVEIDTVTENKVRVYSIYLKYWRNYIIQQNKEILLKKFWIGVGITGVMIFIFIMLLLTNTI